MAVIDTRTYDFSDLRVRVGQTTFKVLGVSYKLNRTIGKGRDNTPKKSYRTRGFMDPDGEIRMYLHDRDDFFNALVAASPTGAIGDAEFEVTATYGTDNQPTVTDILTGCTLMDVDSGHEAGEDPLEVTYPIDIMDIEFNGKRFFNDPSV